MMVWIKVPKGTLLLEYEKVEPKRVKTSLKETPMIPQFNIHVHEHVEREFTTQAKDYEFNPMNMFEILHLGKRRHVRKSNVEVLK